MASGVNARVPFNRHATRATDTEWSEIGNNVRRIFSIIVPALLFHLPYHAAKLLLVQTPQAVFNRVFHSEEMYVYEAMRSPSKELVERVDQHLREQNIPSSVRAMEFCRKIFYSK